MDSDENASEVDEELEFGQEEDDYSVDFEEESHSPPKRASSPLQRSMKSLSDDNYSQATFEEESQSPRHVINLNVPRTSRSPVRSRSQSPQRKIVLTPSPGRTSVNAGTRVPVTQSTEAAGAAVVQLKPEYAALQQAHVTLQQQQSELKGQLKFAQLRYQDELRVRRERFQAKKKRAEDRRWKHEQELRTAQSRIEELESTLRVVQDQNKDLVRLLQYMR